MMDGSKSLTHALSIYLTTMRLSPAWALRILWRLR